MNGKIFYQQIPAEIGKNRGEVVGLGEAAFDPNQK